MASSTHQLKIKATDQTGGAFSSIAGRANALNGVLGKALGAVGAYMGLRSIKSSIEEMGHLSDLAMKTGMSANNLQQMAAAFNVLGIQNMGIDQLGKAMDYLQKNTGRTGKEGFLQTIEELAKIPDLATRGQLAMKYFGRTGMELAPIISGAAKYGIEPITQLMDVMPSISDSAVNAGDQVADAMGVAGDGVYNIWKEVLGNVCKLFGDSAMEGSLNFVAWVRFAVMSSLDMFNVLWTRIGTFGEAIGAWYGTIVGGGFDKLFGNVDASWGDVWNSAKEAWSNERQMAANALEESDAFKRIEERAKVLGETMEKNRTVNDAINKSALSADGKQDEEKKKAVKLAREPAIKNALVAAGSNAAMKLILGNGESRQIDLLRQIAENTKTTAANTDGAGTEVEVME